jgi:hypothetical protein
MKNSELWKSALIAAFKCSNANAAEINTALEAVSKRSPIAARRVARALSNAGAHGGLDSLNDADRELVINVLGGLSNPAGRLPFSDTAADGHIHLRVTMERKNRYVRSAKRAGKNLSDWMTETCDSAAGATAPDPKPQPK